MSTTSHVGALAGLKPAFEDRLRLASLAGVLALALATPAFAAVPTATTVEGALLSSGGAPAADGDYDITFALYAASSGGAAVWTEGPVKVKVAGGRFAHTLGGTTALEAKTLAGMTAAWLGVKVGSDAELPRQQLLSAPYALVAQSANGLSCTSCVGADQITNGSIAAAKLGFNYAASATKGGAALDLACTGCVSVAELKFDGDVDMSGYSLKAKNGSFTGDVVAKTVTATSFAGDGSKLTGIKTVSGKCDKDGEVVKGINADGSLLCAASFDANALPKDGLNEISNDLLSNQFIDVITADDKGVAIPDNTGLEAVSNLTFPDIGVAQAIDLNIEIKNTDLSTVAIVLLPPDDKKVGITICDPCGSKDAKSYKTAFPPAKPKSGDVQAWVGKNPKGTWNLKVKDTSFCIPQAPGNSVLCNVGNKSDGEIVDWSFKIQTLSNQKVQVQGNLIVKGDVSFAGKSTVSGAVTYADTATFKDYVFFENSWCPTQPNGTKSAVIGGVCTPGVATYRTWPEAVDYCASMKADLCSDAQALVLRRHGMIGNYTSWGNWTNSYADNDAGTHHEATGNIGDDHSVGERHGAPCCYHVSPKRPEEQLVKLNSNDVGLRVVAIHNVKDASFQYAATYCTSLGADVCDKSQYVYLRAAGKISVTPLWPNDGQDTDGSTEYGTSGMSDNSNFYQPHGFACCARGRTTLACPAGSTDVGGVCMVKVNNSGSNWQNAAKDCVGAGAHVCSVSESSVLRKQGKLTHSGNWTGGFNDCDGQCGGSHGIGNASNNLNQNSTYGYACCL
jgi:hypothetical protein